MRPTTRTRKLVAASAVLALGLAACGGDDEGDTGSEETGSEDTGGGSASGSVAGAGSSTVLPVAEFIIETYVGENPDADPTYESIGSGGGFERLCAGEVDFSGASRAIREEEVQTCEDAGIEFTEMQFGNDALTMVTSPETDYLECMTNEDIVEIFGPEGGNSLTWDQVLDDAPAEPVDIFAPDTDSGTYGFMVEDVMGLEESTQDYSSSADDNVIVQGVQSGAGTWGFFGLAYFAENAQGLRAIAYDSGDGTCVAPSVETAEDGSYGMVRPLFLYVNNERIDSAAGSAFINYFLDNAPAAVSSVGYVEAPSALEASSSAFSDLIG